jgi:deoxyribodipyrimidine photo-lyase
MRQLWEMGWMHNRVRMSASGVLCKQLGINWLEGAQWFWDTLVDANLANNTMGWQWSAGCGADAAPYFRILNPILQAERFDPKGRYVKKWCPELNSLTGKEIFHPHLASKSINYPHPIVDLKLARLQALARKK